MNIQNDELKELLQKRIAIMIVFYNKEWKKLYLDKIETVNEFTSKIIPDIKNYCNSFGFELLYFEFVVSFVTLKNYLYGKVSSTGIEYDIIFQDEIPSAYKEITLSTFKNELVNSKINENKLKEFPMSVGTYAKKLQDEENIKMSKHLEENITVGKRDNPLDKDNWSNRSTGMICKTCVFFVLKKSNAIQRADHLIGRCRKHAPTMNGFPVVFSSDWCGDHKLHEDKI